MLRCDALICMFVCVYICVCGACVCVLYECVGAYIYVTKNVIIKKYRIKFLFEMYIIAQVL